MGVGAAVNTLYQEVTQTYHVTDADDADSTAWVVDAVDEDVAAATWAKAHWADHDYPTRMECFVFRPDDGKRWHITVSVESQPVFFVKSQRVK